MFQRGEITQSMFSGHNAIMSEIIDKKTIFICFKIKKYTSKWNKYTSKSKRKPQWKLENIFELNYKKNNAIVCS